jgi:chromosome partitioning protein
MKTITLCGFKGGTCRTSTTLHLGSALAAFHNKRVLLVDFDPQANLSTGLGMGTDNLKTMVPVLQGEMKIHEVIQRTAIEGMDIIPANTFLDQIESTAPLVSDPYAHERLRKALKTIEYDFTFIDIPPSLGWLCQSAFFASQHSIICSVPEPYSVLALNRLEKYHQAINENHTLTIIGVLFSLWDGRGATNKAINRAILQGLPVFETDPSARVSLDYKNLAKEFLTRITQPEPKKQHAGTAQ